MKCYYCDVKLTQKLPEGKRHHSQVKNYAVLDHVWPVCLGGDRIPEEINLVWSCNECNERKNGTHPLYFYHRCDFSHWDDGHRNDFMWKIKAAIIIANAHGDGDAFNLYYAEEPEWFKSKYGKLSTNVHP